MANRIYNKQVSPKGYKAGGRAGKMGGGMMMQRPMMQKGGRTKKMTEAQKQAAKTTGEKIMKGLKKSPLNVKGAIEGYAGLAKKIKNRMSKKMGGPLKPVDPKTQKGLSKLPTEVRNKMGYMKDGGKVKKVKPLGKKPKPGTYDYYLLNRPKHSPAPIKPKPKKG